MTVSWDPEVFEPPTPHGPLARRCRAWLFVYPRKYRRRHGAELVGTLVSVTPPGYAGPPAGELLALLLGGLRTRLGRPASRVAVLLGAVAAGLVLMVPGVAIGQSLAWHTAAPAPATADARTVVATALPDQKITGLYHGTEGPASAVEFAPQYVGTPLTSRDYAGRVRDRMRRAGWRVSTVTTDPTLGDDGDSAEFSATRDALALRFSVSVAQPDEASPEVARLVRPPDHPVDLSVGVFHRAPAALWPARIAGGLLGLLAGWFLFGWFSRNTAAVGVGPKVAAGVLSGFTGLLVGLEGLSMWVAAVVDTLSPSQQPLPWVPASTILADTGAVLMLLPLAFCLVPALVAVAVATISRHYGPAAPA